MFREAEDIQRRMIAANERVNGLIDALPQIEEQVASASMDGREQTCAKVQIYRKFQIYKITKAIHLYDRSLCLPSSPFLTKNEIKKITSVLK